MKKFILILLLIVVFHIFGFIGFFIAKSKYDQDSKKFLIKAIRNSQSGLINPLIDYEIDSGLYIKSLKVFKNDVEKTVNQNIQSGNINDVAVYFRSLTNGPWFGIKEDENFFPASLLKVPLMIAYYKWSEIDLTILKKEVKYEENLLKVLGNFNNTEYFKAEDPIEVGKTYTVEQLIEKMIVNSDNNAKNLLILTLDKPERLFNVYTDLGITTPPELKGEGDIFSVHEYATFFRILYNASYLNKDNSEKALQLLTKVKFTDGLPALLPNNIKIAHKFGEYQDQGGKFKQLHDCGIVYYPSYPYIACFMTRGNDFEKMKKTIQDLSLTVYQEIDKQVKRGEN